MTKREQNKREQMTREHGWEDVEGGTVEKWDKGVTVSGTFLRMKDGSLQKTDGTRSKLVLIRDESGETRIFGVPSILESRLESFEPGDECYIRCLGKTLETAGTKRYGNKAWEFEVKRRRLVAAS